MKKQNRKQGFTLVELLVVIAILAILATVSIVGYTAFIKKAHESNALAEAHQIKEVIRSELISGESLVLGKVAEKTYSISHNGQNAVLTVETTTTTTETPAEGGDPVETTTTKTDTYTIKLESGAYVITPAAESAAWTDVDGALTPSVDFTELVQLEGTYELEINTTNGLSLLYTYTADGAADIQVRINLNDLETVKIVPAA